jgi:hypothetical protein
MDKFLIFDKINFYGQHILKSQDILINNTFNLNSFEPLNEYKILYLIYEYDDILKAIELKNNLKNDIIFVIMDNYLTKFFRRQNNVEFYSYIQIFRIFSKRE